MPKNGNRILSMIPFTLDLAKSLGSIHTLLAIAMHSLVIAVLAKEWVGMPFLSEILSKNLSFSSVAHLSLRSV